jgi:glycolate oxidase
MAVATLDTTIVDELVAICGEEHVFTGKSALFNRARVPAPFPAHRWDEHIPQAVVLPTSAERISEVVKLANRERIPVVPRAGGTGLTDGAVPLKHGILVDVKLMNEIHEIDVVDRTVTVGPGINMLKLNEQLRPYGFMYPDNPASYPCSLVGGRIGTNGWSLCGSRFGHVKHLVISFELVLPTGEIIRVGHGGPKNRSSSSGYQLKELFMGHQGTLGIVTEATLELVKRPEAEFSAFWSFRSYEEAWKATGELARSGYATIAGVVLFDEQKVAYLRRDDEAYIPQPDWAKAVVACAMYGNADEVRPGAKETMRIGKAAGGAYLGDEISQADWWARHDRYATPLHGRIRSSGQVVPMSWHCEDAAILYSKLPEVRERWHRIVDSIIERYGIFDDWGMFAYTSGPYKPWGDYLAEIDVGIWEMEWNDDNWAGWVDAKREIARVSVESGGSISACHGSCREGEVDLVPVELGGAYEVMKRVKRALDPNNIMNPGKYLLDQAYELDEKEA